MSKPTVYLSLDTSKGCFFQFSKENLEGFKRVERNNKVHYRRDCDVVEGVIRSISERDRKMINNGTEVEATEVLIGIEGDEANFVVSVLRDSLNGYSTFAESFFTLLPNIEKDVAYILKPYSFIPEGKERALKGFSLINKATGVKVEKLKSTYTSKEGVVTEGQLPERKFVEKRGKWTIDQDDYLEALYQILEKAKADFPYVGKGEHQYSKPIVNGVVSNVPQETEKQAQDISGNSEANLQKPVTVAEQSESIEEYYDDDELPF